MYSSTTDLLVWQKALFGGKVLNPASLAYLTHRGLGHYGAGEANNTRHGETIIEHSGGIEGFSTSLSYLPGRRLTVIVLSNLDRGTEWVISGQLMDVMLGDPVSLGQDATVVPAASLERLAGAYVPPATAPDEPATLSVVDGKLYIQRGKGKTVRAFYEGSLGNSMRFVVLDGDYEFQTYNTGKVPTINLRWNSDEELTRQ